MSKKLTLKSSDGETFEVDKAVAAESQLIKGMIEDDCADGVIPLPNVTSIILARVIEFCNKHAESGSSSLTSTSTSTTTSSITEPSKSAEDGLKAWDADFIKVDHKTLYDLFLAADYLNIKSLLDLTRQTLEDIFKGKTIDEIREIFIDVTLKSSDGMTFVVYKAAAEESQLIKCVIEDCCADGVILLPNVTSTILSRVAEYCKKHFESRSSLTSTLMTVTTSSITEPSKSAEYELRAWDADFVKVDQETLFDLILAANYLNIKSLLDLTCQAVEDMIKGMTPAEIRKTFNIKNEFTPEEEEEVRRENQWAFE